MLLSLQSRGLIKCLSSGNYMRTTKSDTGKFTLYLINQETYKEKNVFIISNISMNQ